MFGHVGDEMVNVVASLPPANAEAAAEVGDECADECVVYEVSGDAAVTGVMGCEHDLLLRWSAVLGTRKTRKWRTYPEESEENGGCHPPFDVEEEAKAKEESAVTQRLPCVGRVVALVQALSLELLVQLTVVHDDGHLCLGVERRVCGDALDYCLLFLLDGELVPVALLLCCCVDGGDSRGLDQRELLRVACRSAGSPAYACVLANQLLADERSRLGTTVSIMSFAAC